MAASLGITMSQAWDTELPDLWALLGYLRKHPPVHVLVASYLGYKAPDAYDPETEAAENEAAITRLAASEFDALVARLGLPPMSTPHDQQRQAH